MKNLHFYFSRTSGSLINVDCLEAIGYGGKYQITLNTDANGNENWTSWFLVRGLHNDNKCIAAATGLIHAMQESNDHYVSQQNQAEK